MEKALSTKSVRDFEKEISMVSYDFEAVEEFYSRSSTRDLVGNIKVPLLFIQVHTCHLIALWQYMDLYIYSCALQCISLAACFLSNI